MKKHNFFAKKDESSFLKLVKQITESVDDETEGFDFDDEADDLETEDMDAETETDDFGGEEEMDDETVTISIPRSAAMTLIDALQAVIGETEEGDDFEDEDTDTEGDDFDFGDDEEMSDDADADEFEETEEEDECDKDAEEDEEVLGSNQSNVAQSTISRDGAPKRSKANTSWNTGKTVRSVFDQTASGEGEPAGVSRDGAPKRSKLIKGWNNSKTVSSRLQPGKHIMEIGK